MKFFLFFLLFGKSFDIFVLVIREWSILAIRNLCEDNLENQKIIENLNKLGDAKNPIVTERTDGSIRIKSSEE